MPRQDGFDITVASEVMAVPSAWRSDLMDLKDRLGRMVIAYTYDRKPVTVSRYPCPGRHDARF
jgi:formate--tetrahydrofolate ligase